MVESLEVSRRLVAQRRVQPAGVVAALDEAEDLAPRLGHRREAPPVQEFALERREEALADPSRRWRHPPSLSTGRPPALPAARPEGQRRVLQALVAMMDHSALRPAAKGVPQRPAATREAAPVDGHDEPDHPAQAFRRRAVLMSSVGLSTTHDRMSTLDDIADADAGSRAGCDPSRAATGCLCHSRLHFIRSQSAHSRAFSKSHSVTRGRSRNTIWDTLRRDPPVVLS